MPASVRSSTEGATFIYPPSPTRSITRRPRFSLTQVRLPPSPVDSYSDDYDENSATVLEEKRLTRKITRGTPGDHRRSDETQSLQQRDVARKRSQYYDDAFAVHPPSQCAARDQVLRESFIMAEIKTNIDISDEISFITEMSYALAARYQRPVSSIIVTLTQSCCLLFGGSFESSYILSITALPSQMLPTSNKRNALMLGKTMESVLGIPPERGIIKFIAIPEDNLATYGRTVAWDIDDMEKAYQEDRNASRSICSRDTPRSRRMPSIKSLRSYKANLFHHKRDELNSTPPMRIGSQCPLMSEKSVHALPMEQQSNQASRNPRMGRRKSFITSIFGRI